MNCILIDDEPLAIEILVDYCMKVGFVEVVGTFTNPLEAIPAINEKKVDVIFCDIEMPQINGLDFISALENRPLFIFTTAYSQYAVEGFELNAVDYLVKPIPYQRFIKAITIIANFEHELGLDRKNQDYREIEKRKAEANISNSNSESRIKNGSSIKYIVEASVKGYDLWTKYLFNIFQLLSIIMIIGLILKGLNNS